MKIFIGSFVFLLVSCQVYKKSTTESQLVFEKIKENKSSNDAESDWITFNVSLIENKSKYIYIPFDALSFTCYFNFIKSDSIYQKDIKNLKEIPYSDVPVFVIENNNGEFKYFLKRRLLNEPIIYRGFKIIEPVRADINPCHGIGPPRKKEILYKKGKTFLGKVNIYEYDLKVNENDTIVRLHFLYKNHFFTSNWIEI